jgi:hypothetical protein
MKQAVNKTEPVKTSTDEVTIETKTQDPNKTEANHLLALNKTKLFNRFLEANCDCV